MGRGGAIKAHVAYPCGGVSVNDFDGKNNSPVVAKM